jgi:hypothetical protein
MILDEAMTAGVPLYIPAVECFHHSVDEFER